MSENLSHSNFIEELSQVIPILDIFLDIFFQESKNDDFYINGPFKKWWNFKNDGRISGKEWFGNIAITPAEDQS